MTEEKQDNKEEKDDVRGKESEAQYYRGFSA
jgi:hypothetical protein